MNKKDLPVPAEYEQASQRFSIIWNDYVQREEDAKSEFINMVKILESNGYTRTKAIGKIVSDHKHLKGFSRMTIYRSLPDNMKRKYESSNIIMLPDNSDVSNDTFEQTSQQPIEAGDQINQLDAQILQEKNQLLLKELEITGEKSRPLKFVKQYTSKDLSLIHEYEGIISYEGKILPLHCIIDFTEHEISSLVVVPDKYELFNKTMINQTNNRK
jgi:hypothetical protein